MPESSNRFPSRPASEVEWEDLLLRLELMPRALALALERSEIGLPEVASILRELVEREARVCEGLDRAAANVSGDGSAEPTPAGQLAGPAVDGGVDLLTRFASIRRRTFAIVQRRGIDVWEWPVPLEGGPDATVFRVLSELAAADAATLAAIRNLRPVREGSC